MLLIIFKTTINGVNGSFASLGQLLVVKRKYFTPDYANLSYRKYLVCGRTFPAQSGFLFCYATTSGLSTVREVRTIALT